MNHRLSMRFMLHAPPYDGTLFRATTPLLRLSNEFDFASCQQLRASHPDTRYHVSYGEKYRLLEWLIGLARAELDPIERVLLTSKMPSAVRFTPALLAPDVFMCHDPAAQAARMEREGRHVLVIRDQVVRHPLEYGDNSLELEWLGPRISPERFARLGERLAEAHFLIRCTSGT